jgi:fatty acid desaturase
MDGLDEAFSPMVSDRQAPVSDLAVPSLRPLSPSLIAASLSSELRAAGADLANTSWRLGVLRLLLPGLLLVLGSWFYWTTTNSYLGLLAVIIAGVAYALLLICTHEAIHGTLLGVPWLEFALSCLIGWPMAWPAATYYCLHLLHHRWNGLDPRDPERIEPLQTEIQSAGFLRRWHQRHPFWWKALGLGGLGMIANAYGKGWRLCDEQGQLANRLRLDLGGTLVVHLLLLTLVVGQGIFWKYLLFWLTLERVIGAIIQTRSLIEHWGLWRHGENHLVTQLLASRTVIASKWMNAAMGGLPHHSAHHAFPCIPFQRLPEATERIEQILSRHGREYLPKACSYLGALRLLL